MTICEKQSGGRILCLRLSGLGDIVHALNALTLLRRERPDADIAWAVEDRFAGLLKGHPCIDELIIVPRSIWMSALRRPWRWPALGPELWDYASALREKRFDISIDFQSSVKSAWLVLAAGAELRVGFDRPVSRELNRIVQTSLVRVPTEGAHRIERDLALLAPLGIPTRYAEPILPAPASDGRALDEPLAARSAAEPGQATDCPLVILHPGTSRAAAFKRWLPERYARVADELVARRGARVLVTYGPDDKDLAAEVVSLMRAPGASSRSDTAPGQSALAPPTADLQHLALLLSRADLFIGSDTGPMHIASALNVPVVALFGPKDPVQTGPYCSRSMVVLGQAGCRPCNRRRCSHVRCMTSITTEQVLDAALSALDGDGQRRAHEGPIKQPFTVAFRLGEWRGRVTTCYSTPAFYARLCNPEAMMSERAASSGERAIATVPGVALPGGGPAERLLVERGAVKESPGLRNAWNCALRVSAAQASGETVPFPACYMKKGKGRGAEHLLVSEEVPDAVVLRDWLTADGAANWLNASTEARARMIDAVARLVRRFHMANYCHGDLTDTSMLIRSDGDPASLRLSMAGLERARWIGWLPPVVRDALYGRDIGKLQGGLAVPLSGHEAARFFETYCSGFIRSEQRRRVVARAATRVTRLYLPHASSPAGDA